MSHRLIEVYVPSGQGWDVSQVLSDAPLIATWRETAPGEAALTRILVEDIHTEAVLNRLEQRFEDTEGFRAIILPVEATIPRIELGEEEQALQSQAASGEATTRISIQELYEDVAEMSELDGTYLSLVALSAIVAAIGLVQNNIAVIIGSMVIAPLLGPIMGQALASTLADLRLAWTSTKANVVGIALAGALTVGLGYLFPVDPTTPAIELRTQATLWDVGLGLAVGAAGVLSMTTGVSTALVGVMVAVALVPPLAAAGLLAGAGFWVPAFGAVLLLTTYIISINLAGVVVFVLQGVRPRRYYEADRARRATISMATLWVILLALLALTIMAWRKGLLLGLL